MTLFIVSATGLGVPTVGAILLVSTVGGVVTLFLDTNTLLSSIALSKFKDSRSSGVSSVSRPVASKLSTTAGCLNKLLVPSTFDTSVVIKLLFIIKLLYPVPVDSS